MDKYDRIFQLVSTISYGIGPQYFLPSPIQTGEWDYESIHKEFVLLVENDNNDNKKTEASLLQKMHSQWNASCCSVLPVTAATTEERDVISPLPFSHEHFSLNPSPIKVTITSADKNTILRFLTKLYRRACYQHWNGALRPLMLP